jgi:hypothetical protein
LEDGPPRGQITFSAGQRPTIEFFESADVSTAINLLAVSWLDTKHLTSEHHPEEVDDPSPWGISEVHLDG